MRKVLIIGGGPAGMLCAIVAGEAGHDVAIIEKNKSLGKKLLITGKGRCNLTNDCDVGALVSALTSKSKFLYSAFSVFGARDTMKLFTSLGLPLKTERGNRVFPESDRSADVLDALKRRLRDLSVKVINDSAVEILQRDGTVYGVRTKNGVLLCDKAVIATGGASYPVTGSTGDGYEMAEKLGHTITPVRPSLVPIEIKGDICPRLMGLSLKNVGIRLFRGSKETYSDFGEMIFTHFGVSGPIVLSASSQMEEPYGDYEISIDLKPALGEETLDNRLIRDLTKHAKKSMINALFELLPSKMIPVILDVSQISPNKKCADITKEERGRLLSSLKDFRLYVRSLRPIDEAIITKGGVSTKEINPSTMESKLISGLYFCGEVIDEDAYTGGFNLQIAFSTAYTAGKNL